LHVHVDPLVIADQVGELADRLLRHLVPLAGAHDLVLERLHVVDAVRDRLGHARAERHRYVLADGCMVEQLTRLHRRLCAAEPRAPAPPWARGPRAAARAGSATMASRRRLCRSTRAPRLGPAPPLPGRPRRAARPPPVRARPPACTGGAPWRARPRRA